MHYPGDVLLLLGSILVIDSERNISFGAPQFFWGGAGRDYLSRQGYFKPELNELSKLTPHLATLSLIWSKLKLTAVRLI